MDAESLSVKKPRRREDVNHMRVRINIYYLRSVKRERNLAVFIRILEKILVEILKLISCLLSLNIYLLGFLVSVWPWDKLMETLCTFRGEWQLVLMSLLLS